MTGGSGWQAEIRRSHQQQQPDQGCALNEACGGVLAEQYGEGIHQNQGELEITILPAQLVAFYKKYDASKVTHALNSGKSSECN
jgi:hypothetical protein